MKQDNLKSTDLNAFEEKEPETDSVRAQKARAGSSSSIRRRLSFGTELQPTPATSTAGANRILYVRMKDLPCQVSRTVCLSDCRSSVVVLWPDDMMESSADRQVGDRS